MGVEMASRTQVYVLRIDRESDGSLRLALKVRGADKTLHFANMEALTEYLRSLEASFKPRGLR